MSWIVFLFCVSSFVDGFKTFGNLKDYQFGPVIQKRCVLPQYPEKGSYIVINHTKAGPGDVFDEVTLIQYSSNAYYEIEVTYIVCASGVWSGEILKRVPRPIGPPWNYWTDHEDHSNVNTNPECCVLPPYPEHGLYMVQGDVGVKAGDELESACLEYACAEGYSLVGNDYVCCEHGVWYDDTPECFRSIETQDGNQVQPRLTTLNESRPCELPVDPEHGRYVVFQQSNLDPGADNATLQLSYTCDIGYGIVGEANVNCSHGVWSDELPTCVEGCKLGYTRGVSYLCKKNNSEEFSKLCDFYEPSGAEVLPLCDAPYYSSSQELPPMVCVDGNWNYTPVCSPECGIKKSGIEIRQISWAPSAAGGRSAQSRELPWHVGIYDKYTQPYKQICGGSIVSSKFIVTAAHCFWNDLEGLKPSARFAVAAGKLYRPWSASHDYEAQLRDVSDIVIPKRFRGIQTNFQDDIAIMRLTNPFVFNMDVWPVCIDFDLDLDRTHLTAGNLGKVAGWGLTEEYGKPAVALQVVEIPYVEVDQCINDASPDFRSYITSDKICAGYTNGTALCMGDSGGGLAFPKTEGRFQRYYLRGVASTAPGNDKLCNTHAVTTFTQILTHEHFIKDHLNVTDV